MAGPAAQTARGRCSRAPAQGPQLARVSRGRVAAATRARRGRAPTGTVLEQEGAMTMAVTGKTGRKIARQGPMIGRGARSGAGAGGGEGATVAAAATRRAVGRGGRGGSVGGAGARGAAGAVAGARAAKAGAGAGAGEDGAIGAGAEAAKAGAARAGAGAVGGAEASEAGVGGGAGIAAGARAGTGAQRSHGGRRATGKPRNEAGRRREMRASEDSLRAPRRTTRRRRRRILPGRRSVGGRSRSGRSAPRPACSRNSSPARRRLPRRSSAKWPSGTSSGSSWA